MLELVATYQTLAAGFLTFAGVVIAMRFDARLKRRERLADADHQSMILRRSIRTELRLIYRDLASRVESIERAIESGQWRRVFIRKHLQTEIYDHSHDKLGLLRTDEIEPILEAYGTAKECSEIIARLSEDEDETHVEISEPNFERLIASSRLPIEKVRRAIGELSKHIGSDESALPTGIIFVDPSQRAKRRRKSLNKTAQSASAQ